MRQYRKSNPIPIPGRTPNPSNIERIPQVTTAAFYLKQTETFCQLPVNFLKDSEQLELWLQEYQLVDLSKISWKAGVCLLKAIFTIDPSETGSKISPPSIEIPRQIHQVLEILIKHGFWTLEENADQMTRVSALLEKVVCQGFPIIPNTTETCPTGSPPISEGPVGDPFNRPIDDLWRIERVRQRIVGVLSFSDLLVRQPISKHQEPSVGALSLLGYYLDISLTFLSRLARRGGVILPKDSVRPWFDSGMELSARTLGYGVLSTVEQRWQEKSALKSFEEKEYIDEEHVKV